MGADVGSGPVDFNESRVGGVHDESECLRDFGS